jgi:hypothetical protein
VKYISDMPFYMSQSNACDFISMNVSVGALIIYLKDKKGTNHYVLQKIIYNLYPMLSQTGHLAFLTTVFM